MSGCQLEQFGPHCREAEWMVTTGMLGPRMNLCPKAESIRIGYRDIRKPDRQKGNGPGEFREPDRHIEDGLGENRELDHRNENGPREVR